MTEPIVKRSAAIHLNGTPADVFPLFTPVGEYQWIPGWNPDLIYPASGEAMTNNVFATQHASGAKTIWMCVDYDPEALHADYVNVTPGSHTSRIEIQCQPSRDGGTDAQVSYTVIAIAEAGYAEAANISEAAYAERMKQQWQQAINDYLERHAPVAPH